MKSVRKTDIRRAVRAYNKKGSTFSSLDAAKMLGVSASKALQLLRENGASIRSRGRIAGKLKPTQQK